MAAEKRAAFSDIRHIIEYQATDGDEMVITRRPLCRDTMSSSAPMGWSRHTIAEAKYSEPLASRAS
jgi:hypothetical protein